MCGIAGYSSEVNFNTDKLKLLILYNESRGEDATGMWIKRNGIIKVNGKASEKFIPDIIIPENTMAICHTRKATRGAKITKNAHPFRYGNIIGCQNGMVKNVWDLCKENDLKYVDIDVDSQVIYALMDKIKADNPNTYIEETIKKINQETALLFTDLDTPDVLYAYRNKDRPLFRGLLKFSEQPQMYISSIKESLEAIGCDNIKEFKEEYLYSIQNGRILGTPKKLKIPSFTTVGSYNNYPTYGNYGQQTVNFTKTDIVKDFEDTLKKSIAKANSNSSITNYTSTNSSSNCRIVPNNILAVGDKCMILTEGKYRGKMGTLRIFYPQNGQISTSYLSNAPFASKIGSNWSITIEMEGHKVYDVIPTKDLLLYKTAQGEFVKSMLELQEYIKITEVTTNKSIEDFKVHQIVYLLVDDEYLKAQIVTIYSLGQGNRRMSLQLCDGVKIDNSSFVQINNDFSNVYATIPKKDDMEDPQENSESLYDTIDDIKQSLKKFGVIDDTGTLTICEQVEEDMQCLEDMVEDMTISREKILESINLFKANLLLAAETFATQLYEEDERKRGITNKV